MSCLLADSKFSREAMATVAVGRGQRIYSPQDGCLTVSPSSRNASGQQQWFQRVPLDMRVSRTGVTVPVAQESVQENHRHIRDFGTNLSRREGKTVGCGDGNPLRCCWLHRHGERLIVAMAPVVPALKPQLQVVHANPEERQ
jgi:hypothetical protein